MDYLMDDYQKKSIFYSFLPGISGEHGIPLWCHYLNRGQCIASFGVKDKDHAMMEFYPAHQAAERTPLYGFRTFLRVDGVCKEAFTAYEVPKKMFIGMNRLQIQESLETLGLDISIEYECLVQEPLAGLMRKVTITNQKNHAVMLEVMDGMAEMLPYGITSQSMKEMGQTSKAWMQAWGVEESLPMFRVRASMEDSAEVKAVEGVHFGFAKNESGELLPVLVDREVIFASDSACLCPHGFFDQSWEELLAQPQVTCNDVPSCFFLEKKCLGAKETLVIEELYGMAESEQCLKDLVERTKQPNWFEQKREMAIALTEQLTERIATKTGNVQFDGYCRQTFLDNLLRGGYPVELGGHILYLYSRKHGDMERDYNYFSMLPEYYSQGNGNFRDVNQNRRCDVSFSPFVGLSNIKTFYNALQINGYNALEIRQVTYTMPEEQRELQTGSNELLALLEKEYTAGELYHVLEQYEADKTEVQAKFEELLGKSKSQDNTRFVEGYWSDHWTYNLDLLENYLSIYPDKERELLFEDESYLFAQAQAQILPRRKRYAETKQGLRQYQFLKQTVNTQKHRYLKDKHGAVVKQSLMAKLLSLCTVKIAALDPFGMGIEMEGGKPGWYDALNGLPGLLGSSMAESYELERLLEYLLAHLQEQSNQVSVLAEIAVLAKAIVQAGEEWQQELASDGENMNFWNQVNDAKEAFWEATTLQVDGKAEVWNYAEIRKVLLSYQIILRYGLAKSARLQNEVPATYYYYKVESYQKIEDGILPTHVSLQKTPDFLEGAVHSLKLCKTEAEKQNIYTCVKKSHLFDEVLHMYKVNASLSNASFELGRACAFTPGWLENESVWLHMEYKYLLELLKSGLYEEFCADFHQMAIPFLSEESYGRSPLENCSFLASSKNPNKRLHGKGFVARLSGSTAEFLQMWQIMMFGIQPFMMYNKELCLKLQPMLPAYLIGESKQVEATFLGSIPVTYLLPDRENFIPNEYKIIQYELTWKNGSKKTVCDQIVGVDAKAVRDGEVTHITALIDRMQ